MADKDIEEDSAEVKTTLAPAIYNSFCLDKPVNKCGNWGIAQNYRPVGLSGNIVKVSDKLSRNHLEVNDLVPERQHGFRSMRST